jgi:hypothetical protein
MFMLQQTPHALKASRVGSIPQPPSHENRMPPPIPAATQHYLAQRLDGARDLYLLALAVGERDSGTGPFGAMIQESRIHFESVIVEARMAGLDTTDISGVLGKQAKELIASVKPEVRERLGLGRPKR